jgi:hypothetical protein
MNEVSLTIPTDILRTLYGGVSSTIMGLKSIVMTITDDKLVVWHINETRSGQMKFESRKLESGIDFTRLPIDVSDLGTVVNLAKDSPTVTFVIGEGQTICKIGKTKKKFTQPDIDRLPDREPKFEIRANLEFNDDQTNTIISTFSNLKEKGDLMLIMSPEKAVFKVEDDNRSTETEFEPGDLVAFSGSECSAGYDLDMAISMFRTKQKGSNLKVEFGKDVPVRIIQDTPSGKMSILLAPKIYD